MLNVREGQSIGTGVCKKRRNENIGPSATGAWRMEDTRGFDVKPKDKYSGWSGYKVSTFLGETYQLILLKKYIVTTILQTVKKYYEKLIV